MFVDPQVVTIAGQNESMPRVDTGGRKSIYAKSDEAFKLTISHSQPSKDRIRSMARIDQRAIVADPLSSENDYETLSVYVVIDRPVVGFSATALKDLWSGLKTWLNDAAADKLYGQES